MLSLVQTKKEVLFLAQRLFIFNNNLMDMNVALFTQFKKKLDPLQNLSKGIVFFSIHVTCKHIILPHITTSLRFVTHLIFQSISDKGFFKKKYLYFSKCGCRGTM